MDTHVIVETPESVRITYEVAGIGSRFVAQVIDLLILTGGYMFLIIGYAAVSEVLEKTAPKFGSSPWPVVIIIILSFLYMWGYFIFFESLWAGQTPGKRALRLRVIQEGGYPAPFSSVVLRNLIRVVDWAPLMYCAGLLTMLLNKSCKRIGDFAAGTIVIKERGVLEVGKKTPGIERTLRALPVERLGDGEIILIKKFLGRRKELDKNSRAELAYRLAVNARDRMSLASIPEEYLSLEDFLEKVVEASSYGRHLS